MRLQRENLRMVGKLGVIALGMFAFGYALVPIYRAVCDAKGSTATVEGKFGGDFQYNFQGELSTSYTPALNGVTTEHTEIEGRRLAPCRGDQPVGTFLIKGQNGVGNLNLAEPIQPPAR